MRSERFVIAAAASVGGTVAFVSGAAIYSAAIVWALFGVIVAKIVRQPNPTVAIFAGVSIPLVVAAALA